MQLRNGLQGFHWEVLDSSQKVDFGHFGQHGFCRFGHVLAKLASTPKFFWPKEPAAHCAYFNLLLEKHPNFFLAEGACGALRLLQPSARKKPQNFSGRRSLRRIALASTLFNFVVFCKF